MTATAHDIAAALRERLPGLPTVKLHKLLYYCQGHHLAAFGQPLFPETICAWDMGPVVASLWGHEKNHEPVGAHATLGEAELNTIGYVLSRYGALTGTDLIKLSHEEDPWRYANVGRRPGTSVPIPQDSIREYFATDGAPGAGDDGVVFDSAQLDALFAGARERLAEPGTPDTPEAIREWLARA